MATSWQLCNIIHYWRKNRELNLFAGIHALLGTRAEALFVWTPWTVLVTPFQAVTIQKWTQRTRRYLLRKRNPSGLDINLSTFNSPRTPNILHTGLRTTNTSSFIGLSLIRIITKCHLIWTRASTSYGRWSQYNQLNITGILLCRLLRSNQLFRCLISKLKM